MKPGGGKNYYWRRCDSGNKTSHLAKRGDGMKNKNLGGKNNPNLETFETIQVKRERKGRWVNGLEKTRGKIIKQEGGEVSQGSPNRRPSG